MNNECLVKPKESLPKNIKRTIKNKLIIETSIANSNDLKFLYLQEIIRLFVIHIKRV